jgi:hypothetical protein
MRLIPATLFASVLAASSVSSRSAVAQWSATVEVGADRFWGGSVENAPEHRSFRPFRPTTFGLGIDRRRGKLGMGVKLQYASAGLGLEGGDAFAAINGVFTRYSVSPEVAYRIGHLGSVNELLIHAGPLFEAWSVTDEETQLRMGIQGALSLSVPFGRRLAGSFTAGAALTPSPFGKDQLDSNYERRALWRRRMAAGLEFKL